MNCRSKKTIAFTALLSILLCFVQQAVSADIPYEDSEFGVSFILPGNWEEAQFRTDDPVYMDAKYINRDSGDMIIFGASDMWSDEFEDEGISRSDLSSDLFTIDEYADMIGMADCEKYEVKINGIKYFVVEFYTEEYGSLVTNIQYTYINNAVMYQCYYSSLDRDNIDDFESMIYSIEYHDTSVDTGPFAGAASSEDHTRQESESILMYFVTAGLVGAFFGVILILFYILINKLLGANKAENSAEADIDAVMRSKKRIFALERYSKDDPYVPMKFFYFYTYFRFPITIINFILSLIYYSLYYTQFSSVIFRLSVAETFLVIAVFLGLFRKKHWGIILNTVLLVYNTSMSAFTWFNNMYIGAATLAEFLGTSIGILIVNILIMFYFEKRKFLFDGAPAENNEPHQMAFSDYQE